MSTGNGLALIFFGDPLMDDIKTKGGTRSMKGGTRSVQAAPTGLPIDEDVAKFEVFLEHCVAQSLESNFVTVQVLCGHKRRGLAASRHPLDVDFA
jgi:hypothetical protein